MPREAAARAGIPLLVAAPPALDAARPATAGPASRTWPPPRGARRSPAPGLPRHRPAGGRAPSAPPRSTAISSAASSRRRPHAAAPAPTIILARGPFAEADERALLETHGIDVVVAKNSGGAATYGKIAAAARSAWRSSCVDRPPLPGAVRDASRRALARIDHLPPPPTKRGV